MSNSYEFTTPKLDDIHGLESVFWEIHRGRATTIEEVKDYLIRELGYDPSQTPYLDKGHDELFRPVHGGCYYCYGKDDPLIFIQFMGIHVHRECAEEVREKLKNTRKGMKFENLMILKKIDESKADEEAEKPVPVSAQPDEENQ